MDIDSIGHFYAQVMARQRGCVYDKERKQIFSADGLLLASVSFHFNGFNKINVIVTPIHDGHLN